MFYRHLDSHTTTPRYLPISSSAGCIHFIGRTFLLDVITSVLKMGDSSRALQLVPPSSSVFYPRLLIASTLCVSIFQPSLFQPYITRIYSYLYSSSLYRFSGFETLETVLCYIIIEPLYTYKFGKNSHLRIDMRGAKSETEMQRLSVPKMRRPSNRMGELLIYAAPLLAMDFTLVKKFAEVSVDDIRASAGFRPASFFEKDSSTKAFDGKSHNVSPSFLLPTVHNMTMSSPLQLHRALPPGSPTSRRIVLELCVAFFIYDTLFFIIHIIFHRVPFLARIHSPHHTHGEIHPQVTNHLSVSERLSLVLMANFALNIIGSHVLTRSLFVPIFVYLLVEVHCGLELDWGYHRLLPEGWGAGSKVHAFHHRTGRGGFQPFFCWWDRGLEWVDGLMAPKII